MRYLDNQRERIKMNNWRVLPMEIFGVKLYAVESSGYIEKYCDTKQDAEEYCKELNKKGV